MLISFLMEMEGGYERPKDEDILEQEENIRSEVAASSCLVGDQEPLNVLLEEYSNPVLRKKIEELSQNYQCIRRIRGDGNCFYRACLCGLLERKKALDGDRMAEDCLAILAEWKTKLVESGFQLLVFEDAMDMLVEQLEQSKRGDFESTLSMLRDSIISNFLIMLLRMITAAHLKQRAEHFEPFILNYGGDCESMQDFCEKYVLPMGVESDHMHAVAFAEAMKLHIRIEYLDRSEASAQHDFTPEGNESSSPDITLLYRPGHYDVIDGKA